MVLIIFLLFFFFNDTATTEIYTLSLHDALPICGRKRRGWVQWLSRPARRSAHRSEEHTSELQSRLHLVCRLLLGKKQKARCGCPVARPEAGRFLRRGGGARG